MFALSVRRLRISQWCGVICATGIMLWGFAVPAVVASQTDDAKRHRIFIVSSYHREYLWSKSTNDGVMAAMLRYSFLENQDQVKEFAEQDYVESKRVVLKKTWMDTKRKNGTSDIARSTVGIMKQIREFQPDLVMLGDDNAANYIGNQLLDTEIPVVFWGINGLPLKYGLIDSMDRPGHNITGVWQAGYYREGLELLSKLVPEARTFAILACDSVTARANIKQLQGLHRSGGLPLDLVDVVSTNDFEEFKLRAKQLESSVDAFFVLNHDTLKDDRGNHLDMLEVGRWYLENIRKPEASHEDQFVREGMLLTANDSGYNQGYAAFEMAYDILEQGLSPQLMRTKTPAHGPLMVNRNRARALGISLTEHDYLIDEFVDTSAALER
ncbi:MAG: hypothetical protein OEO19_07700 [Gammaproteobacteria bacterium]|nr:hypothetical protein [Gammaproteobacteria bacterium]MDH3447514.1 hypothetical protein [Gammaproteobacteria bacterium]